MKKDYLFPGAIALVLIAIPLFGFRHSPAIPVFRVAAAKPPLEMSFPTPPPDNEQTEDLSADTPAPAQPVNAPVLQDTAPIRIDAITENIPDVSPLHVDSLALPKIPLNWKFPGNGPGGDRPGFLTPAMLDYIPKAVAQIAPHYPLSALHNNLAGQVTVQFWVDESGRVHQPRVISASSSEFAEPTLRAVAQWRFEPGRKDGQVTKFEMAVPVEFHVND